MLCASDVHLEINPNIDTPMPSSSVSDSGSRHLNIQGSVATRF